MVLVLERVEGAEVQQLEHGLAVAPLGGDVQGRVALVVGGVEGGAATRQDRDHVLHALGGGVVQGRRAGLVLRGEKGTVRTGGGWGGCLRGGEEEEDARMGNVR